MTEAAAEAIAERIARLERLALPAERLAAVRRLGRTIASGSQAIDCFQRLLAIPVEGPRFALEFLARRKRSPASSLVLLAAPHLQERSAPLGLRLAVAGRLLAAVPDSEETVGPILRCATVGLNRARTLQRYLELQSHVVRCVTLDRAIDGLERRVRLKCPACGLRFRRPEFVPHLWHEHRFAFVRGQVQRSEMAVEEAIAAAADAPHEATLDRAFAMAFDAFPNAEAHRVLRAIAARGASIDRGISESLQREARERGVALCPRCLNALDEPKPQLPPPLNIAGGRLAARGYAVEVDDRGLGRSVRVETAKGRRSDVATAAARFDPRLTGTIVAVPIAVFALVELLLFPTSWGPIWLYALGTILLAILAYVALRYSKKPLENATDLAIDVAWRELAPKFGRTDRAVHWLTRLCRSSLGRGTPSQRVRLLRTWREEGTRPPDGHASWTPWQVAVHVLSAIDRHGPGANRHEAFAELIGSGFTGSTDATFAELASELLLAEGRIADDDRRTFAIRLIAAAFEAELSPAELRRLLDVLPHLDRAMGSPDFERLALLRVVWNECANRAWNSHGSAMPIFELVQSQPAAAKRLLAQHPEAMFRIATAESVERVLGELVLTARGLFIGDLLIGEPRLEASISRSPRGSGWILALGAREYQLDRRLDESALLGVQRWLDYWQQLLATTESVAGRADTSRLQRLLKPLVRRCTDCGIESLGRAGHIAEPWTMSEGAT